MFFARGMRFTRAIAAAVAILSPSLGAAEPRPDCTPVCSSTCVKPITIADRWAEVTGIPGPEAWAHHGGRPRQAHRPFGSSPA